MSSPTSCGQSAFKSGGGKPIGYTYRSITLHFVPFILYLSYFTYSRHTDFDQEINILKPPTIYITNFIDQITRSPKKSYFAKMFQADDEISDRHATQGLISEPVNLRRTAAAQSFRKMSWVYRTFISAQRLRMLASRASRLA